MIRLQSLLTEAIAPEITTNFKQLIKNWENNKDYAPGGWNKTKKKWYPHKSPEGGTPTIAYGHKLTPNEVATGAFKNGITDEQADQLMDTDLAIARNKAMKLIPNYSSLPESTKQALINACYRGELSEKGTPNTLALMRAGKWESAAAEYVNHNEYRKGGSVKQRMDWNAAQFKATNKKKATPAPTKKSNSAEDILKKELGKDIEDVIRSFE